MALLRINILFTIFLSHSAAFAQEAQPLRIGVVASLSGFASTYGTAVLEGVELAAGELAGKSPAVKLVIEDDGSETKGVVTAYKKLRSADRIEALIGGSWWVNSIVRSTAHDRIPFISCETLLEKTTELAPNYFLLQGDLRNWMRAHEPEIHRVGYKRGTILRFSSGFGVTLEEEMRAMFSVPGREFLGAIEYNDINLTDAASVLIELRKKRPDVVFVDAQPAGLATLLKKAAENSSRQIPILTHSIADDLLQDGALDKTLLEGITFTSRKSQDPEFVKRFEQRYRREPRLNSDLGYYALHLLHQALHESDPIEKLKDGNLKVNQIKFTFDNRNALQGLGQDLYVIQSGAARAVSK